MSIEENAKLEYCCADGKNLFETTQREGLIILPMDVTDYTPPNKYSKYTRIDVICKTCSRFTPDPEVTKQVAETFGRHPELFLAGTPYFVEVLREIPVDYLRGYLEGKDYELIEDWRLEMPRYEGKPETVLYKIEAVPKLETVRKELQWSAWRDRILHVSDNLSTFGVESSQTS